jgi:hypothetical protein
MESLTRCRRVELARDALCGDRKRWGLRAQCKPGDAHTMGVLVSVETVHLP